MVMNISLNTADIIAINISTLDFRICQLLSRNWTKPHLQKLRNVPEVPVSQLYGDMTMPVNQFTHFPFKDDVEDLSLICTILKHPGTYIESISMIFVLHICVYCFRFWIRPVTPRHQPYSPVSS